MKIFVIVRAFKGEPLQRVVLEASHAHVLVANPDSLPRIESGESSPLALPRSDVFEFDGDLYQSLQDEFKERGETSAKSWRSLRPWAGSVHGNDRRSGMSGNRYYCADRPDEPERSFGEILQSPSPSDEIKNEARRVAAEVIEEVRRERKQAGHDA